MNRSGFSLVELMVALVILTVGVLALAGATGMVVRTVTGADLTTQRSAALTAAVEELRSRAFDDVASGSREVPPFQITWTAVPSGAAPGIQVKQIQVVTVGPGLPRADAVRLGGVGAAVADTLTFSLIRP